MSHQRSGPGGGLAFAPSSLSLLSSGDVILGRIVARDKVILLRFATDVTGSLFPMLVIAMAGFMGRAN